MFAFGSSFGIKQRRERPQVTNTIRIVNKNILVFYTSRDYTRIPDLHILV